MYNRYIPQPDGTYRRNKVPDVHRPPAPTPAVSPPEIPCPTEPDKHPIPQHRQNNRHRKSHSKREETSVPGFLKRLLPKDFDTGDLIVVLLLLLMAGDCTEDQNTALLTLALYFLM